MKTVVVANQKGGVGKTAFALHLAWYFSELKNKRVLFIDLDTQANASYSLSNHKIGLSSDLFLKELNFSNEENTPLSLISSDNVLADIDHKNLDEVSNKLKINLDTASSHYDICIIDTAPSFSNTLVSALFSSDYVISPIELETYSIQGISKMIKAIVNIKKYNANLNFLGMLPSKVDGRNIRHKQHLIELNEAYSNLMIPLTIGLRSSVADAVSVSQAVWHNKKTAARKAAMEFKAVSEFVFNSIYS